MVVKHPAAIKTPNLIRWDDQNDGRERWRWSLDSGRIESSAVLYSLWLVAPSGETNRTLNPPDDSKGANNPMALINNRSEGDRPQTPLTNGRQTNNDDV
ncbi:MAG: hypothetical protein VKL39_04800 [Leptolyngbyaceae bacterium]|nr:hypothetical protein [Leptolyngbyaceae bacterium]